MQDMPSFRHAHYLGATVDQHPEDGAHRLPHNLVGFHGRTLAPLSGRLSGPSRRDTVETPQRRNPTKVVSQHPPSNAFRARPFGRFSTLIRAAVRLLARKALPRGVVELRPSEVFDLNEVFLTCLSCQDWITCRQGGLESACIAIGAPGRPIPFSGPNKFRWIPDFLSVQQYQQQEPHLNHPIHRMLASIQVVSFPSSYIPTER